MLLSERNFHAKIDWEGGVEASLDYGLDARHFDLPKDVRKAWKKLVRLHARMEKHKELIAERAETVYEIG